jgi:hypothetical protein
MADLVWSDPDPEKEDFAISPRSAFCFPCFSPAPLDIVFPFPFYIFVELQRRWIHLRLGRCTQVPRIEFDDAHPPSASTLYGRLRVPV